ncbi:MAG: OprO/OprP family phosphate-selective porin, partial [Pirellulaceae bacterium]
VTALTDAWWTIKELPLIGNLRIGNQKEQIGFEHIVSSRFQPFIERSYNQDAFYGGAFNGFTPGIQAFNWAEDEMGVWALGLFKPTDNVFAYNANDGDYAVTGRITRLLWYANDGAGLLHVGLSGRQFTTVGDRIRYRTREAIRAGAASTWPIPADTGVLVGDDGQFVNGELVAVYGPWTFQAEYLFSFLEEAQLATAPPGPNVGTVTYHGGYVQLFYFLTGEHDNYVRRNGVFERVTPRESFFLVNTDEGPQFGLGAWQIGARYNYLDLNDSGIDGGQLHNGTAGVNWFLNPNMKVQFNYIATYRDAPLPANAGDGWIHGWGMRVAHDF